MGKLKSVLTAKKKKELLSSFKKDTISIINIISALQDKSPEEKMLLIESLLVLSEIVDLEQERVKYELLVQ
ncbi:MAG: hypothetical protein RBT04_10595 [Sphaerochaetaceae bacterium]|jgi:hypothetical protein|nr:hypothetical protein [Sphaerochaetaceae bacterium]